MPRTDDNGLSLNDTLAELGFTTAPSTRRGHLHGQKDILRHGRVVFSGSAHEVWQWLYANGLIEGEDGTPVKLPRCDTCGKPELPELIVRDEDGFTECAGCAESRRDIAADHAAFLRDAGVR